MNVRIVIGLAVGAAGAAALMLPAGAQQNAASGPIARYDMRAGTVSGMAGMGAGGMMGMMFGGGGGNRAQHELYLRLGTSRTPQSGSPKADHFMPPSAKLGKSVALVTPRGEKDPELLPEKPKGRLLIFWGCGERAPKGQPVVIDFARVAAGQMPAGMPGSAVVRDWGPTLTNSRTFGRWPAEDGKYVKADSALPGAHRVVGNYTPDISFTLTKDFMAPLSQRTSSMPSGATMISWTSLADATGYLAGVFGGKMGAGGNEMGDMVMWTSSATRQFGGGLGDWITPAQAAALSRDRTVLPPSTTNCAVPVEVIRATPDFRVGTLTAFGPMEEFVYPPRPTNGTAWRPEWTARIRHRSMTSWMQAQGMTMGGGAGAQESRGGQQQDCKPKRGGFGGVLGGVLGGGGGSGC